MKITVVGALLIVAAVAAGVLVLLALNEVGERTLKTSADVDLKRDEPLPQEMSTLAQ